MSSRPATSDAAAVDGGAGRVQFRVIPDDQLEALVAQCDTALAALAGAVHAPDALRGLSATVLKPLTLRVQALIDQLTAAHALVICESDRALVWLGSGARDMAGWLADTTNSNYRDAVERQKLGTALEHSPTLRTAVEHGNISVATATQLHGAVTNPPASATTADLDELIEFVAGSGPRDAAKTVEHWKATHQKDSAEELEQRRYQRRSVRRSPAVDGMVDTLVTLPVLQADMFHQTLAAIAGTPADHDHRTTEQRNADALIQLCNAWANGEVVGGRERPTVLVTITAETLAGLNNQPCTTANGDPIPAHVVRHLAESAILQRVVHAGSVIIDMGQRVRLATDHQYKALITRDGGCRWPGCNIPAAWCEIDHLTPWEHGGRTDLHNLAMWCTHHHHEKHRHKIHGDALNLHIELTDGTRLHCPPKGTISRPRTTSRTTTRGTRTPQHTAA